MIDFIVLSKGNTKSYAVMLGTGDCGIMVEDQIRTKRQAEKARVKYRRMFQSTVWPLKRRALLAVWDSMGAPSKGSP